MRIGIDTLFLDGTRGSSLADFVIRFTSEMIRLPGDDSYVVYAGPTTAHWFEDMAGDRLEVSRCAYDNHDRLGRIMFQQLRLPSRVKRDRIDVLCCLADVAPLAARVPVVLKVNSLHHLITPKAMGRRRSGYRSFFISRSVRKAAMVVTNSQSTEEELALRMGTPRSKMRLIYEAVDESFSHEDLSVAAAALKARFAFDRPFLLFASVLYEYKNLRTLIDAFARLVDERGWPGRLVVAGHDLERDQPEYERQASRRGVADRVVLLGGVVVPTLRTLYSAASVFVYPSLSETFGKPLVEAMRCGTPVVASRAGSIPEIAGDAALLVDPLDNHEMADAIYSVLADAQLRARLVAAGSRRCQDFSWPRVIDGFHRVITEVGALAQAASVGDRDSASTTQVNSGT
jgi:glycosyltransferase involved in cell wall biosynthesis